MNTTKRVANRWYIVQDKSDNARCLVEANAPGQALRRAAERYCTVRTATVAETIEMIRGECDVISAPSTQEQMEMEDIPGVMPHAAGKEDGTPEASSVTAEQQPGTSETGQLIRETTRRAAEVFGSLPERHDGDDIDEV